MKKNFRNFEETLKRSLTVPAIELEFQYSKSQALSKGGMKIDLLLTNSTNKKYSILNPLDYLKIIIIDEEGWSLNLPVASPNPKRIKSRTQNQRIWPFKIVKFSNVTKKADLPDMINLIDIEIEPKSKYKISLLIDKVQKLDKKNPTLRSVETQKLRKGKYDLKMRLAIFETNNPEIMQSCDTENFTITLK